MNEKDKLLKLLAVLFLALLVGFARLGLAANQVRDLLKENRLDEALTICRQFEVLKTSENDNNMACSWVYLRTENVDSALTLLEKLKTSRAPEYQLLQAFAKIKSKRYDEAKRLISTVTAEHKGNTVGLTAEELNGELYEAEGQLDTAAFIYKHIVSDDPSRARSHWGLGRYYLAHGDTRRAIMHLEKTSRLWPKHLGSRFNLGVLYLSQENYKEAARWLDDCYKLNRADVGVLEQIGILFEKKGMMSQAVKYWQKAIQIKKDSPVAKEKLATYFPAVLDSLIQSRQYEQALSQIEKSSATVSQNPKVMIRRAVIYRNLKKIDKAISDLQTVLASNPNDSTALRELGVCYVNQKQHAKALTFINRAVKEDPQDGMNHAWLAFLLEAKGNLPRAKEEWKTAVELLKDPDELQKATRRLASVEEKLHKSDKK